jgi:hypothetical protein
MVCFFHVPVEIFSAGSASVPQLPKIGRNVKLQQFQSNSVVQEVLNGWKLPLWKHGRRMGESYITENQNYPLGLKFCIDQI